MKRLIFIQFLFLAAIAQYAHAERVLAHYDLDSLSYLSETIIRAQVGDFTPFKTVDGDCVVYTVTVLDTFKGPAKSGGTFQVAGLDEFHRAPGMTGHADTWGPIQKGDVVYLFLVTNNGKMGYSKYRLTTAKWTVIESGARLLDGKLVYAFGQIFGTGHGMGAVTHITFPGAPIPSRDVFEAQITQSFQTIEKVDQLLAEKPTPQRHDQIIKMIRDRAITRKLEMTGNDKIDDRLVEGLRGIASAEELLSLRPDVPWDTCWQLENMLQTNAGRDYLLHRVADQSQTMADRLQFADILSGAGDAYALDLASANARDGDKLANDFASKLAKLAAENLRTELVAPLLRGIADCASRPASNNPRLIEDLHHAAKILSEAFDDARPDDQFQIAQTMMQIDSQAYRQLLPNAGLLLTQLQPDKDFIEAFQHRSLHMVCQFRNLFTVKRNVKLVLHPVYGGPDVEIPIDTKIGEQTNTFGYLYSITAAIPDSASGTYRVFLRNYGAGQPDGDGLGFEIDVPKK